MTLAGIYAIDVSDTICPALTDVLKKQYKCWFDVIENITVENGVTTYKLKETERKMDFIVRKKDKLEIGDKVLCISEGYAFKYNQES